MLCTMSGSNRFNSSRKKCAVAFALAITLTQTAPAQQYTCHGPGFPPYNSAPFEGLHSVRYAAYIPFDHLTGATPCFNSGLGSILKIYKGDPNAIIPNYPIQSARAYHLVGFTGGIVTGVQHDSGQTRNYGFGTPVNGSTLSALDEDNVPDDCIVWNASAYASTSDFHEEVTFPYSTQGQAHQFGTTSNPLEPSAAKISWDMRTVVDYSNLDYVTGIVNYTHSCFPGHVIQVNNKTIYQWEPTRSDQFYVFGCLVLQ